MSSKKHERAPVRANTAVLKAYEERLGGMDTDRLVKISAFYNSQLEAKCKQKVLEQKLRNDRVPKLDLENLEEKMRIAYRRELQNERLYQQQVGTSTAPDFKSDFKSRTYSIP